VPGVFVQDDWAVHGRVSLSGSARVDRHPEYGTFTSPRASALVRVAGGEVRASYGAGFFAPTALTEDTDEVGLAVVTPTAGLRAELGRTWSADYTRAIGPVEVTATVFGARVRHPLGAEIEGDRLVLTNRVEPDRASGAELFARLRLGDIVVNASHAWVRATEGDSSLAGAPRVETPLTPRRSWSVVAAWEAHGLARVGLEIYRTGRQRLDDNPYRTGSAPYTIVGLLAERRLGRARVFINLENLTDVRLSRTHPFLRSSPTTTGRWTVDAWAPLEGRTINGGVRVEW
jgi:iron complex outermembrane receptor protein